MTNGHNSRLSRRRYAQTVGIGLALLRGIGTAKAADGDEIWRFETGDWVLPSPTVVDGTVLVGGDNNNLDETADACNKALTNYQAAPEELNAGATATRTQFLDC